MAAVNLTAGAIAAMCNGDTELNPVLQVVDIRLVNTNATAQNTTERYRVLLSDGVHLQQGMLATQRNELVKNNTIQKGSLLQLFKFVCSEIQGRPIIVVIDLEVIQTSCPSIGDPKQYVNPNAKATATVSSSTGQTGMVSCPGSTHLGNSHSIGTGAGPGPAPTYRQNEPGSIQQPKMEHGAQVRSYVSSVINRDPGHYAVSSGPPIQPRSELAAGMSGNAAAGGSYGGFNNSRTDSSRTPSSTFPRHQQPSYQQQPSMYMNRGPVARNEAPPRIVPVAALNPYQGRWTIKARVTAKNELRHYNNARGDGKVFSFDLLDSEGGEIRVTCFNNVADQFYGVVEVGKVYVISKGSVKPAQKNYNHLPNDYEILLDNTSVVQPCYDDDNRIPKQQFHFRPISDIGGLDNNSIADVIGIVTVISPTASIMKKNGTETQKRSLQLKDSSGRSVELTMWGNLCNTDGQLLQNLCDTGKYPVLAVKAARVNEFNGKSVSTLPSSQLFIEPDFPEGQKLKEWFNGEGRNLPCISISREMTSLARTDVRKTLSQIKDEKLGTSEKPDWITVCATLSFMKMDNFCYTACPIQIGERQCNKKVTNNGDGKWRCDRCDQTVDECDYRYILQFQIQDHTAVTWVTAFQECGEQILGLSAKDLYSVKYDEENDEKFQEIVRAALLHKYVFQLKVKEEAFNDEQRVKSTVVKAERLNFVSESRRVLDQINMMKAGDSGAAVKTENVASITISGPNISGIGLAGAGHSAVSGVSYGTNSNPTGKEIGGFSHNTSQYGNQYSGGFSGSSASGIHATCNSCGGTGHTSSNCPSIINGPGQPSGAMLNQAVSGANPGANSQCYKCQKFGHFARDCPGLSAIPPAYGSSTTPGRYGGAQRQHVGGF